MKGLIAKYRELILYVIFGAGTFLVDVGLYALLVDPLGIKWANAWSWCGAVAFAFVTNKYWVFARKREGLRAFLRQLGEFVAARLVSLVLQVQGVDYLVRHGLDRPIFGLTGGVAKLVVTVVIIIINYILSKFLVFRGRRTSP
jgi:putative flippase GtrA